jgi:hypothetical protein
MSTSLPHFFQSDPLLPDLSEVRQTASDPAPVPSPARLSLRPGCYLVEYTPATSSFVKYDGTLRVGTSGTRVIASGDLYERQFSTDEEFAPAPNSPWYKSVFHMTHAICAMR